MLTLHKTSFVSVLLIVVALATNSPTPRQQVATLFPIVKDGKWGFIDRSGKIVIAPQFDGVSGFHDGLARVTAGGRVVFINVNGQIVLTPQFQIIDDFSEGLAAVNMGQKRDPNIGLILEPGRWGYIDKTGKLVIPLRFTHAEAFSEGLAGVKDGDRGGFIDHAGKIVFEVPLDVSSEFHDGLVLVHYRGGIAYYDRAGKRLQTPPLDYGPKSYSFSEGLAAIETKGNWGFIDKTGKLVIDATFVDADSFSEGLAGAEVLIDRSREKACVDPQNPGSSYTSGKKFGYIDKTGKMVIPPRYEYAGPFVEGMASVTDCYESFFIDRTGKVAIPGRFRYAFAFHDGLAQVQVVGSDGLRTVYTDKTGKMIWEPSK